MPRYRYTGTDSAGRHVKGERDAANPDALLTAIGSEVWVVDSVQIVADSSSGSSAANSSADRMRESDAAEISGHIAELVEAQLPLESGLAAIAAECPSWRRRSALRGIVQGLASGTNLETVLAERGAPAELRALVKAGARSGNTGRILEHYVVNVQGAVDLRQSVLGALAYPLLILLLVGGLGGFLAIWIVPQFRSIFEGFDLNLPIMTVWLMGLSAFFVRFGLPIAAALLVFLFILPTTMRIAFGAVGFRRIACRVPLIGPVLRWTALSRFSQLLSLLIENEVPLDEALMLAGDASGDSEIQDDCRRMLAGVTAGETLESAARKLDRFPASFVQALSWECRPAGLPEVLQSLGDMYAGRVRAAIAVLLAIFPPLCLIALAVGVGFVVISLFMPLIELLNKLS